MSITFPTALAVTQIDEIRNAIGRECIFNTATLSGCTYSGCTLNPVTNTSTNSFCPVCGGDYWIQVITPVVITGHITWYPEQLQWWSAGQHYDADVRIQIKYTDSIPTIIDSTDNIEVDGKVVEIKRTTNRGFQEFNRVILDCREREK